jgi:hypothetical protein
LIGASRLHPSHTTEHAGRTPPFERLRFSTALSV